MSYIAIDYGKKRIGVAYSDESNSIAVPHSIVKNDKEVLKSIGCIIAERNPQKIIVGKSVNFKGENNIIQRDIEMFKINLKTIVAPTVDIVDQEEFLTSAHVQNKNDMLDASAAALILQRFLDREGYKNKNT